MTTLLSDLIDRAMEIIVGGFAIWGQALCCDSYVDRRI
jgi:hypothetical protein